MSFPSRIPPALYSHSTSPSPICRETEPARTSTGVSMISHLSLGVSDLDRSGKFYDALLAPLGCSRSAGTKMGELAYGPAGHGIFWLYEVADEEKLSSPGTHVAFQASDRESLHAAADAALARGCTFTREAGSHPDIGPEYYGAIFLDPDGHKIELVVE